ncbi:MAG: cyclic pyranopterin monophosphate synthase MoaC [Acidobacteria bacterium]|nr:cyclic pyranopterin monophosphate synthase MoaC [Acidobacteriota bacterium]
MSRLSHLDPEGRPRMVDVSGKGPTLRRAVAAGCLRLGPACARALEAAQAGEGSLKKGDPWSVARIGGVNAVKRTSDIIPLAHPVAAEGISVDHLWDPATSLAWFRVEVVLRGPTGVEMEAMAGVCGALLTLYDMLKAVDHAMELGPVRLLLKEGGRRGTVTGDWPAAPWKI